MPHKPILGLYSGHNQESFDPIKYAELAKTAGFKGSAIHGLSPWDMQKEGFYPFKQIKNAQGEISYDLTQLNQAYFDQKEDLFMSHASNKMLIVYKYFDSYFDPDWRDSKGYLHDRHPWVENNTNIHIREPRDLYVNAFIHKLPDPLHPPKEDFKFLWWKSLTSKDVVLDYEFLGKFGQGIKDYVLGIKKIIAKTQAKYPNRTKVIEVYYNEGHYRYKTVNGKVEFSGGLDPDERNLQVYRKLSTEAGIKPSPKIREFIDFKHSLDGEIYWQNTISGYNTYLRPRGLGLEHHGIRDIETLEEFFNKGISPLWFLPSSDGSGDLEQDLGNYCKVLNQIMNYMIKKFKHSMFDYKVPLFDGWKAADTMFNMRHIIPLLGKGIIQGQAI